MVRSIAKARNRVFPLVLTALLSALLLLGWTIAAIKSPEAGWDFPVFYIAGHVPLASLYDAQVFDQYWRTTLQPQGVQHWAPFIRLPLFALPLRYLLSMSYYPAYWLWAGLGCASYLLAIALLLRRLKLDFKLFLPFLLFLPATAGIVSGADIGFFLLSLVLAFLFLEHESAAAAAVCLTLCLGKYNLVALLPFMLIIQKRWHALVAFLWGCIIVLASTFYLTSLPEYVRAVQGAPALAGKFYPVGLRGFSVSIGQPAAYPILAGGTLLLCCWLFTQLNTRNAFAAALTGTLMISPYVTWYDSTLLALPILIIFSQAGRWIHSLGIFLIVAVPLWRDGGGMHGPTGFMHIAVEGMIIVWCVCKATIRPPVQTINETELTNSMRLGLPAA